MDSRTICAPDEDYRVTSHLEKENLEKSEFQSGQGKVRENGKSREVKSGVFFKL